MKRIFLYIIILAAPISAFIVHPSLRTRCSSQREAHQPTDLNILLIDHYDSFTFNIVDILNSQLKRPVTVINGDDAIENERCRGQKWDGVVLSPGPGHARDCLEAQKWVRHTQKTPLLGVCLGHQVIGHVYNATVCQVHPIHGQVHTVQVLPTDSPMEPGLWNGIEDTIDATRYHSWQVLIDDDCTDLKETAVYQGVTMGLQHRRFPQYGVQFHPESVGTGNKGEQLLANFLKICQYYKTDERENLPILPTTKTTPVVQKKPPQIYVWEQPSSKSPLQVFDELYRNEPYAYWLDDDTAILGRASRRVEYFGKEHDGDKHGVFEYEGNSLIRQLPPSATIQEWMESTFSVEPTSTVQWIENLEDLTSITVNDDAVPVRFRGGYVGYLGYEARSNLKSLTRTTDPTVPTAAWLRADESLVYQNGTWYLVAVVNEEEEGALEERMAWMRRTSNFLREDETFDISGPEPINTANHFESPLTFVPRLDRDSYIENVDACQEYIRQGESYELCLTNRLECTVPSSWDYWGLYKLLRKRNPAPFSAYFCWNLEQTYDSPASLALCCSSPERFLSIQKKGDTRMVQAKPIKGTKERVPPLNGKQRTPDEARSDWLRAESLQQSVKDRAENLMIVDLLRNDLHTVCETGTVKVPKLQHVESFATVHQLVSTIEGELPPSKSPADVLGACFPGGSMTGAPKLRTTELLDNLEKHLARGAYSGCLGYISWNGCLELNIIIRTAVITPCIEEEKRKIAVGAGGAVTALSEPVYEYEEMELKARSVTNSIQEWAASFAGDTAVTSSNSTEAPLYQHQ